MKTCKKTNRKYIFVGVKGKGEVRILASEGRGKKKREKEGIKRATFFPFLKPDK